MEGGVWGIVIIISAFMIQFLAFGTTATIGVYNIELLEYFPGSTIGVSLIASLNYGIFLGSGPIVSFLMTRFSYRKIAIFGSALVVLGLLGMPLLPYIPTMCICFGVLAGFGSCCAYIPSHVLSGMYYDKNRSLATGVATSGSGLGGAVMPVVAGLLIEIYSWKGSLIVVAALCLHMFIFSALLRMPKPVKEDVAKDLEDSPSASMLASREGLESKSEPRCKNAADFTSSDSCRAEVDKELKPLISEVGKSEAPNLKPLLSEVSGAESVGKERLLGMKYGKLEDSLGIHRENNIVPQEGNSLEAISITSDKRLEVNGKKNKSMLPSKGPLLSLSNKPFRGLNGKSATFSLEDISLRSRSHTVVSMETGHDKRHGHLRLGTSNTDNHLHPHGRGLSHSLSSLHSVGTTRGSYLLVLDTQDDIASTDKVQTGLNNDEIKEDEANEEYQVPTKAKQKGPKSARHIYIFTHYGFNIYFFSNIMWNAACSIVSSFAPEYLRSQGLTSMEAAVLLGAFGFGCFVGGVLGGILGNVSWINRQVLYTLANIFMGGVLIAFPSMGHRDLYLICLLVSGLAFGIILGLLIIVLTDLIGVESLSNGLGYLMLSNGIGTFIGPPLAGILKEATGGFESGIILSGVLCVCGGLIMLLMPCRDMFQKLCVNCCSWFKKPQTQDAIVLGGSELASC